MTRILSYNDTKGLFAWFVQVMGLLYDYPTDKLFVDLSNKTVYFDERIKFTKNVWEYYFNQPDNITYESLYIPDCCVGKLFDNSTYLWGFERVGSEGTLDFGHKTYNELREIFNRRVGLKEEIKQKADEFYNLTFKNYSVFGIQNRTTGVFEYGHGLGQGHLFPSFIVENIIEEQLKKYDKVFLMTDNINSKQYYQNKYNDRVISYDSILSDNTQTEIQYGVGKENPYKCGEDAVIETYLFSKCNKMYCMSSNMSVGAIIMANENKYEFIDKMIRYR